MEKIIPKTLDEVIDELNRVIALKRYELDHDLYTDDAHKYTEVGKISALEGALFLLRRLKLKSNELDGSNFIKRMREADNAPSFLLPVKARKNQERSGIEGIIFNIFKRAAKDL